MSDSCNARMACSIDSCVSSSTKPKPRERPVSRSEITSALFTVPYGLKRAVRSADENDQGKLPTYNLFPIEITLSQTEKLTSTDGSRSKTARFKCTCQCTCVCKRREVSHHTLARVLALGELVTPAKASCPDLPTSERSGVAFRHATTFGKPSGARTRGNRAFQDGRRGCRGPS